MVYVLVNTLKLQNQTKIEYLQLETHTTPTLPVSKSEPAYEPTKWNHSGSSDSQNCYLYAMNDSDVFLKKKPHPGYTHNIPSKRKDFTCDFMKKHIQIDYPDTYHVEKHRTCKDGYYKIFSTIDDRADFHFYRQDSNGLWSHKLGEGNVTNKDASGKLISDPIVADRAYKVYDYKTPCHFMCVRDQDKDKRM